MSRGTHNTRLRRSRATGAPAGKADASVIDSVLDSAGQLRRACSTHRPASHWLFILLIGSYIGIAAYLVAEVLPELRNSRGARRALRGAHDRIDPERRKRAATHQLDVADTLDNRRRLARESFNSGYYQQTAELYRSGLHSLLACSR